MNTWDYRQIRKTAWNTAFHKSKKSWILIAIVCFLFAFIGTSNAFQTYIINALDSLIGNSDAMLPRNIDFLKEYAVTTKLVRDIPFITSDLVLGIIDGLSKYVTWVIRLFAINMAYFKRNPGEIIFNMIVAAIVTAIVRFFIQNVIVIGKNRYVMENRFQKEVPLRRITAPFHKKNILNMMWVMFRYQLIILIWSLTVIGGVYKYYQYGMIPYILAENPSVKWKVAKALSRQMTDGYKMKIFITKLSYIYMWLLKLIPIIGLFTSAVLEAQLDAEIYFSLRNRVPEGCEQFTEPTFGTLPYVDARPDKSPKYILKNINLEMPRHRKNFKLGYSITDVVFMFFAFCFIGWIWEVGLYLVNEHTFVNRGTMYGPWIPIYGCGGVAIVLLLNRFKAHKGKLFIIAMAVCAVLEYASSFILDFIFNASYWDYHDMFMNLNGRICISGLLAFGIGGLFGVYIAAPTISRFADILSKKQRYALCTVLCSAFIADFICCVIFGFNSGSGVGGSY